ncbi:tetratricopeptide repeat protein, partial [Frankia sp. Mgl5]|uniref:tetratricopeptide repeat protein n=1 Tax=Frankia sp. Mgl5 TaxID=2933793 RepID=UPI0020108CF2
MPDDATATYTAALRALWEAARRPTGATIRKQAAAQTPPLKVTAQSFSDWLNGKNVPSDPRVGMFLLAYLRGRIPKTSNHVPALDAWWETIRRQAVEQRRAGPGRGGRPARPRPPAAFSLGGERHRVGMPPRIADCFQHRPVADKLDRAVSGGGTAVLAGMGGVGKTQLAAHYAHQAWNSGAVDVLMWVNAGSREAIQTVYARAAARICGADLTDPAAAAETLLGWLADTNARWLVILDDLADPPDLAGLWPPTQPNGRVLVTTRRHDPVLLGPGRHRVTIGLFTKTEAVAYLSAALAAHGRHDTPDQIAGVAADLGYLPIALAQAAAYITESRHLNCVTYRQRLTDRTRTLKELAPRSRPDDQPVAVYAAWSLSLERANQCRPVGLAVPMLELAAVLDPNGIPETVLTSPPVLAYLTTHRTPHRPTGQDAPITREVDADDARDTLDTLCLLSLADYTPANPGQAIRVHQLIQRAVRDTHPPADTLARTAADALLHAWPDIDRASPLTQALRANTATLHTVTGDALWHPDSHPVLTRAGESLGNTGLVRAAADHYKQLHNLAHQRHSPDHPDTLAIRANLARWEGRAGDAAGAAATFTQLLDDMVRVFGPDHPDTLTSRYNLARWRGYSGDPVGAVAASAQLLDDQLRVLGPDHPGTLATRSNLARWRGEAGNAAGAAAGFAHLLGDMVRVLGPDHPHTLTTRSNLAAWQGEAGDAAGAAAAAEDLLAHQLRVLGPDHPDTLTIRSNLARWRGKAGNAAGAAAGFAHLLGDMVRVLGPD